VALGKKGGKARAEAADWKISLLDQSANGLLGVRLLPHALFAVLSVDHR